MAYKKPWRVAGLLALGILVGYVIGPPIVQAATSLVTIQGGGSTHKAKVDSTGRLLVNSKGSLTGVGHNNAGQLLVGQGAPVNYQVIPLGVDPDCTTPDYVVPAGKALIITETSFFLGSAGNPYFHVLLIGSGGVCTALASGAGTANPEENVNQSYPTGIPVPSGFGLSVVPNGGPGTNYGTLVYGYLVPAGAVSLQQGKGELQIGRHPGLPIHRSGS